jgi:hypothetical protein
VPHERVAGVLIFTKTIALITILGATSVALAQGGSDKDVADRLAKLSARLKIFDSNDNGIIEADEAAKPGAGMYLDQRVWQQAGVEAHYPTPITELLKIAETAYRGGKSPAAAPSPSATAPSAAAPSPPTAAAPSPPAAASGQPAVLSAQPPGTGAPTPPTTTLGNPSGGSDRGGYGAPGRASAGPSGPPSPSASKTTAPPEPKPALTKYRFLTPKERWPKELPDWFRAKADADGQITMAGFTDRWTSDAVAEFEKYDLNHDGIITADECMKVLSKRGGK